MRLAITGASGFFGPHIVGEALRREHEVLAVGRRSIPARLGVFEGKRFSYSAGVDVAAFDQLLKAVEQFRPQVIIHAAAGGVSRSAPSSAYDALSSNVLAGAEVARTARHLESAVIWIGSAFEYEPTDQLISESQPTASTSAYGLAKNLAWQACMALSGAVPRLTLRPFQLYGPGEDAARFTMAALLAPLGRAANQFGDGSLVRDFVYATDAAEAVILGAEKLASDSSLSGEVVNVASGTGTSLAEMANIAAVAAGQPDFHFQFAGAPLGAGYNPKRLVGDGARIHRLLGWKPRTSIADGMRQTLEWALASATT